MKNSSAGEKTLDVPFASSVFSLLLLFACFCSGDENTHDVYFRVVAVVVVFPTSMISKGLSAEIVPPPNAVARTLLLGILPCSRTISFRVVFLGLGDVKASG